MQQPLSDPSIQHEFTEHATGFSKSTDNIITNTNSSVLHQSPYLDVAQQGCPQLHPEIPRPSQSGAVVPLVTSGTAYTADSAGHSSDYNTVLSAPSGLAMPAVVPTHSSTLPATYVPLLRPECQEIHVDKPQVTVITVYVSSTSM
jgi:hypothetical protein